jgi:hypothetical protein
MKAAEDLLLYLMIEDHPVCPRCSSPLVLVGFQSELGKPDFSKCLDARIVADQKPFPTTKRGPLRMAPHAR